MDQSKSFGIEPCASRGGTWGTDFQPIRSDENGKLGEYGLEGPLLRGCRDDGTRRPRPHAGLRTAGTPHSERVRIRPPCSERPRVTDVDDVRDSETGEGLGGEGER
jgi:hypothetical protein